MFDLTKIKSDSETSQVKMIISVAVILISCITIILLVPPPYGDWKIFFYPIIKNPLQPFSNNMFVNPPWTALILYPLSFFSENTSSIINASLNIIIIGLLVIKRKGDAFSLILTLTSFPFISLLANGNIEWIPALGFILQNEWGIILLLTKPQSGLLGILSWLAPIKKKTLFLIPTFILFSFSFIVWGNWLESIYKSLLYMDRLNIGQSKVDISPFPWAIPLGLGLIYFIIKYKPKDSEILGILATSCIVPYFTPVSLSILFVLISVSHRRVAIVLWLIFWIYFYLF